MANITSESHLEAARKLREVLATYEAQRDLILIGAYKKGTDPRTDYALSKLNAVNGFLQQGTHEHSSSNTSIAQLQKLF
jgi:type III secretion protein N (ATPase)